MGRYNNKRTQAAAQAAKNTPSRARFSKGPPNKGGRGSNRAPRKEREPPPKPKSRGIGGAAKPTGRGRNRRNPETTARVIDKIQNRVVSESKPSTTAAPLAGVSSNSIDIALKNLDKSKLDVVAVSKETQTLIADLLRELGVVGNGSSTKKPMGMNPNASEFNPNAAVAQEETEEATAVSVASLEESDNDEDDSSVDSDQRMYDFLVEQSDARNTHSMILQDEDVYEDGDEDDELQKRMAANRRKKQRENRIESSQVEESIEILEDENDKPNINTNDAMEIEPQTPATSSIEGEDDMAQSTADTSEDFSKDKTFLHLTQTLSFSHSQASKACRAIECWDTNIKPQDEATTNDSKKDTPDPRDSKLMDSATTKEDDDKLELVMDWICLHLSEVEINRGFRPNPNASKTARVNAVRKMDANNHQNSKIKAVAHPSISVISRPIEEQAKEWAKAIALQERTLKLMRLGFHRADAIRAFDDDNNEDVAVSSAIDDPALPLLLSKLQDIEESHNISTTEDEQDLLDTAKEEREQELEALQAIYEDRLQVVYPNKDGSTTSDGDGIPERYILQIHPATPLGEPARADECFLHVFLREKYPLSQTPLLLLVTKPGLPPSLCRKILSALGQQARDILALSDGLGCPVVFEAVAYLEDNLPTLHKEFCNEQRRKEFEAEQARLLRQRQIEMEKSEKAMELLYNKTASSEGGVESASGLGRRQKAKIKAAEKAFDRPEQAKALYKEYRRKQEERVKAAQQQNTSANVRATKAQQAILNRQKELIDEEAERAARKALNNAFREGKSKEEAREAAEKARIQSYRENGVTIVDENENEEEETEELEEFEENANNEDDKDQNSAPKPPKPTEASSKFMERLRNKGGKASTVSIDSSTNDKTGAKKQPTKGPTPNTSAFMDRLREMYENAAKNSTTEKSKGKSNKLEGYHLDAPDEDENDDNSENSMDESSAKRPRPVAVPTGELVDVMTDIITQQEDQPWLVSSDARAPTTHTVERKKISAAELKKEKEISERLKNELSRKRKMAKEWAESNTEDEDNGGNSKKPKKNNGKGRKKEDNSFTPEKFHNMMSVRQR